MKKDILLRKLKELHEEPEVEAGWPSRGDCIRWANRVEPLLQFNPSYYANFSENHHRLSLELSTATLQASRRLMISQLEMAIAELEAGLEVGECPEPMWEGVHCRTLAVSKTRFDNGHYADAVESAFKELNVCVKRIYKKKTGVELDGAALMKKALSPNNPVIVLEGMGTSSGKDVQQGYMEIFAGSMTGIRNPKAHDNLDITPERARHLIYLASLLMHKIDERV